MCMIEINTIMQATNVAKNTNMQSDYHHGWNLCIFIDYRDQGLFQCRIFPKFDVFRDEK